MALSIFAQYFVQMTQTELKYPSEITVFYQHRTEDTFGFLKHLIWRLHQLLAVIAFKIQRAWAIHEQMS